MKGYVRATIAHRQDVTDDLAVFKLDWGTEGISAYVPGQYVTLALERSGPPVKRAYSIVSAPHEPQMELHIERVDDGQLTPGLFALHTGEGIWARKKIVGHFTQEPTKQAHVMVATVTGAAPFISMARAQQHALANGTLAEADASRFLLLHGASDPAELEPYAAQLTALAETMRWFTYIPIVSRPWNHPAWTGERGRVGDVLRKHLDAWAAERDLAPADVVGYACGNPQMIEHAKGVLKRAGLQAEHIREEKYFTEAAASASARRARPIPAVPPTKPTAGKRPPGMGAMRSVKPGTSVGAPPRPGKG